VIGQGWKKPEHEIAGATNFVQGRLVYVGHQYGLIQGTHLTSRISELAASFFFLFVHPCNKTKIQAKYWEKMENLKIRLDLSWKRD
jgi:hypothetical protein